MKNYITLAKSAGLRGRSEFRVFYQRSGNKAPYFADAVIYSQAVLSYNYCIIGNSKENHSKENHSKARCPT